MSVIQYKCDRCSKMYQEDPFDYGYFTLSRFDIMGQECLSPKYRLCWDCMKDLKQWFNEGKENALS